MKTLDWGVQTLGGEYNTFIVTLLPPDFAYILGKNQTLSIVEIQFGNPPNYNLIFHS